MEGMMKECMKPHVLAHSLTGFGVGLIAVYLFPGLVSNALLIGVVALVAGIAWDFMKNPAKRG